MGLKDDMSGPCVSKVRAGGGKVGGRVTIPPVVAARLKERWEDIMGPLGFKSYACFRKAVKRLPK